MSREDAPRLLITAPRMGYGHLRAASAIAEALDARVSPSDEPPVAAPHEIKTWRKIRRFYERLSRVSQRPVSGYPAQRFLDWITEIPALHPNRDLSAPTRSAQTMERLAAQGFGRTAFELLERTDATLISAFYAEAIAAARAGWKKVFCVVTDSDVNRVWAPLRAGPTSIRYLAPTRRVKRRLIAYGVPAGNVTVTGFPLAPSLVGEDGGTLRRALARRIARLDPEGAFRSRLDEKGLRVHLPQPREAPDEAPHVVFAIGGAGAQLSVPQRFLPGLRDLLRDGRLRLTLVAGVRTEVARALLRLLQDHGLDPRDTPSVAVQCARDFHAYYEEFNALLAEADVLWTKPSELTFYAGLGIPLILSPPVGVQERSNERWVLSRGAALRQGRPDQAWSWLPELIEDGVFAGAAWSGFVRLPHDGAYRIRDAVLESATGTTP